VSEDPRDLIASIQWSRDWDALVLGFVLGALSVLAAQAVW
jgi:hypothetical protein